MKTFKNWVVVEAREAADYSAIKLRNAIVEKLSTKGLKARSTDTHVSNPYSSVQQLQVTVSVPKGKTKETEQLVATTLIDDLNLNYDDGRGRGVYKASNDCFVKVSAVKDLALYLTVVGPKKAKKTKIPYYD